MTINSFGPLVNIRITSNGCAAGKSQDRFWLRTRIAVLLCSFAFHSILVAEIPASFASGQSYVIDGESGVGPQFAEKMRNTTVVLQNGAKIDYAKNDDIGYSYTARNPSTNITFRVTGGSVVTNYSQRLGSYWSIIVDEGSFFGTIPSFGSTKWNENHNRLAVSNATVRLTPNFNMKTTGGELRFYNSEVLSGQTTQVGGETGTNNTLVIGGKTHFDHAVSSSGYNTTVIIEDDTELTLGNGFTHDGHANWTNVVKIGKRVRYQDNSFPKRTSCTNLRIEMDEDSHIEVGNGDSYGLNGINHCWSLNNAGVSSSNNILRLAGTSTVHDNVRLELLGDKANVCAKNLYVGNVTYTNALRIVIRPGTTGFGGKAPLRSLGNSVKLYPCILDIDLRKPLSVLPAGTVLRQPIFSGTSNLTLADENFEMIVNQAILKPEGARLVKDGKTLYCEAKRKKGFAVLIY